MVQITGQQALLGMLEKYDVKYVFGLPGETTMAWYAEWARSPAVRHVLARDERSAAFMADAYARVSGKPGVCEGPSVGATHLVPGIVEAYKASVPLVVFTTDVPLHTAAKNMLTAFDQTALFSCITKETMTLTRAHEIPFAIRRAFRLATAGKPGPVHIRLPMNVFDEQLDREEVYAQDEYAKCPGQRPVADGHHLQQAADLLLQSSAPVMVCGQGVLFSQAWDEVTELSELLGIPVGTSITGKGSIAETHPLSIGVVGARGGTSFSNAVLEESDLVFYIGCNTDSATTDSWTIPTKRQGRCILHLDISEHEVGNTYRTDVGMIGDARSSLRALLQMIQQRSDNLAAGRHHRGESIQKGKSAYRQRLFAELATPSRGVHPLRLVEALTRELPDENIIVADPGVGAIYASAFYDLKRAGRGILFNYGLGALGYSIPAAVGAHHANQEACIVALSGDGSFGFCAAELETIARVGGNINVIVLNNGSYGWIRASLLFSRGPDFFATDFGVVDYVGIAKGFGVDAYRVDTNEDLAETISQAVRTDQPTLIDVLVESEDELVPPVPKWAARAAQLRIPYVY